jgi:hypothetical protein
MRKAIHKIIVSLFFLVLVIKILFPPLAVMKMDGDSIAKHAFVGYHPIWDPPTKKYAYEFLEEKRFVIDISLGIEN